MQDKKMKKKVSKNKYHSLINCSILSLSITQTILPIHSPLHTLHLFRLPLLIRIEIRRLLGG